MIYKALRATSVLIALLMVMTLGLPGANAEEVERDDAVGLSSRYTNEVKSSALIWKAGLLPGELQHESTLASLIDIAAEDLSTSRAMAPADLAAYTVITGDESIELVPTSEVEQQDVAAIAHVPNMYGYTITTNDLREIGNPLYKKASCYRKKSWNSATMRHDICYWKYRIDEESGSYDYWLYGNELVSTVTRTHRGVPDPYVKYAKVAQQLGYSERTNYMTFGRYDTVKTHAPRGSHYGN